jgi:DNA replication protein DnaC
MYTRQNYKKILEELRESRDAAEQDAELRAKRLAESSEEFRKVDTELRSTGMQLFKLACMGKDITPLMERNQYLNGERERIIRELGLPADYTEPKYSCMICEDTGYIENGTRYCSCLREKYIRENIKSSGIGRLIETQSFDNFRLDVYEGDEATYKRMKSIFGKAKKYADDFNNAPTTLLLLGKTGTGKTHISTAIAGTLIKKGVEVLYDSSQNIVSAFENDRFRSGYGQHDPEGEKYMECELLIIDDLGTEFINQFTISCLYNLINTRQNKGLHTIISSNLDSTELRTKYEGRIHSRILGGESAVWMFAGIDFRLAGFKK